MSVPDITVIIRMGLKHSGSRGNGNIEYEQIFCKREVYSKHLFLDWRNNFTFIC